MALLRRRIPNCCEHDPKLTCDIHEFNSWEDLYDLGFPKLDREKYGDDIGEYLLGEPEEFGFDSEFKGYKAKKVLLYRRYCEVNCECRPNYPPRYEINKLVAIIFECTNLDKLGIKDYIPINVLRENKNDKIICKKCHMDSDNCLCIHQRGKK